MAMIRLLVAASSGILSVPWMLRTLRASIPSADFEIRQFGKNHTLTNCLRELGYIIHEPRHSERESRSEIRKALADTDYLLLLWDGRSLSDLLFEARLNGTPMKVHAIQVTEVVNKDRGDEFDVYIGRGSLWGNPFPVGKQEGQHERDESIALFRQHFEKNILSDPAKRRGLLGLRGLRIACHCKPLACHGDVIAAYLNELDPEHKEAPTAPALSSRSEKSSSDPRSEV